jgi:MFS family permease
MEIGASQYLGVDDGPWLVCILQLSGIKLHRIEQTNMNRGIASSAQAGAQSWAGAMVLRFLMGLFEAGYGPSVPYLLSFFYLRHELGLRIGFFLSAAPLANTFAGALAFGITSGHSKLAKWRLLFLVEGLPTVMMALVTFFFFPDAPEKAKFLDEDEKRVAKARGVRQAGTKERFGVVVWKDIADTALDVKAWLFGVGHVFRQFTLSVDGN